MSTGTPDSIFSSPSPPASSGVADALPDIPDAVDDDRERGASS